MDRRKEGSEARELEVKQCWGGAEQRVDGFNSALQLNPVLITLKK